MKAKMDFQVSIANDSSLLDHLARLATFHETSSSMLLQRPWCERGQPPIFPCRKPVPTKLKPEIPMSPAPDGIAP